MTDLEDYLEVHFENISTQILADKEESCRTENWKVVTRTLPDDGLFDSSLFSLRTQNCDIPGGLLVRILVSSPPVDSCLESLAGLYLQYLEYYNSIGQLKISKIFTVQDLVFLSQRYAAFQGENIIHLSLLRRFLCSEFADA